MDANPYSSDANAFVAGTGGAASAPPATNPFVSGGGNSPASGSGGAAFDPFGDDPFAAFPSSAPASGAASPVHAGGASSYSPPVVDPFAMPAGPTGPSPTTDDIFGTAPAAQADAPATEPPAAPVTNAPPAFVDMGEVRMNTGDAPRSVSIGGEAPHLNDTVFTSPGGGGQQDGLLDAPQGGDAAAASAAKPPGTANCCSLTYYQRYFDVDTEDVARRMRACMLFQEADFLKQTGEAGAKPADLYGALWISTTLWVLLGVCSVIDSKVEFMLRGSDATPPPPVDPDVTATDVANPAPGGFDETWLFDFEWVVIGIGTVYGYLFLGALVAWGVLRCNDVARFELVQMLCVFGYGLLPLLLGTFLTVVPVYAVKLGAIVTSSLYSFAAIVHHIYPHTTAFSNNIRAGLFAAIGVGHAVATFLLFFQIITV